MEEFVAASRASVSAFLKDYLEGMARRYSFIRRWGADAVGRIEAFVQGGKMMRGALAILGHDIYGGKRPGDALRCAAAMELFQAGFLIHDDIMDRDRSRRGKPSFFWQYAKLAEGEGIADAYHSGESMGACGGDVAFFLGFDLLSLDDPPPGYVSFCARELAGVGLAQMQDVYSGASSQVPEDDEIMALYTHKTGRYSFSMPLIAGSMLAGLEESECGGVSRLGELMGILFQIRDDELGLFGNEVELGKPIGSDLREGKKTIYYRALMDSLDAEERQRIGAYFGSPDSGEKELGEVRSLLERRGGRARVGKLSRKVLAEAENALLELGGIAIEHRILLGEILDFVSRRDK